ncbi:MAG: tRNA (adenosine(37)-N6)-threonylcarbamoyltransferase complex ATPase subunit type 1 TsaE [Planctomycetota bacterium]
MAPESPTIEIETLDLAAMDAVGRRLAGSLTQGDVVALSGDLGAGKTTLVRAVASEMGIDPAIVSSPTFVFVNVYPNDRGPDLCHVDAYRLTSAEDVDSLGWDRVVTPEHVVLVEWPDRIEGALPASRWRVDIDHAPIGRLVRLTAPVGRSLSS